MVSTALVMMNTDAIQPHPSPLVLKGQIVAGATSAALAQAVDLTAHDGGGRNARLQLRVVLPLAAGQTPKLKASVPTTAIMSSEIHSSRVRRT